MPKDSARCSNVPRAHIWGGGGGGGEGEGRTRRWEEDEEEKEPVLGLAEPAAAAAEEGLLVAVGPAVLRAALAKPTAAGAGSGSSRALGHVASAASLRRQSTNPSSCQCCQARRD